MAMIIHITLKIQNIFSLIKRKITILIILAAAVLLLVIWIIMAIQILSNGDFYQKSSLIMIVMSMIMKQSVLKILIATGKKIIA